MITSIQLRISLLIESRTDLPKFGLSTYSRLAPGQGSTKQLCGRASVGSGEESPGSPIPGAQGEPQDSQLSETYAARADCRTVVCATCYANAIIRYCKSLWVACGATTRDPLGIMKMTTSNHLQT